MVLDSGPTLAPTELSFGQGDGSLDLKTRSDHAGIGAREMNVFTPGLKSNGDIDFFEEGCAPAGVEASVAEDFLRQTAEGSFEPAESRGEEGGIGDVGLEAVNGVGDPLDNGD